MFALGKARSVIYVIFQFTIRWQWIAPCKRLMSSKVFLQNHASHTHIRHICHLNCLQVILSFFYFKYHMTPQQHTIKNFSFGEKLIVQLRQINSNLCNLLKIKWEISQTKMYYLSMVFSYNCFIFFDGVPLFFIAFVLYTAIYTL